MILFLEQSWLSLGVECTGVNGSVRQCKTNLYCKKGRFCFVFVRVCYEFVVVGCEKVVWMMIL